LTCNQNLLGSVKLSSFLRCEVFQWSSTRRSTTYGTSSAPSPWNPTLWSPSPNQISILSVKLKRFDLQDRVRRVFFGTLSNPLYSVLNVVLQNSSLPSDDITEYVAEVGDRRDFCEAMTADSDGNVYFGLISDGSITRWNTSLPLDKPSEVVVHDPKQLVWINSIFIDEGSIWVVSNRSG
jgi:hypothetical protein